MCHDKDYITLIGWLPNEFYNGGDINQDDINFITYD